MEGKRERRNPLLPSPSPTFSCCLFIPPRAPRFFQLPSLFPLSPPSLPPTSLAPSSFFAQSCRRNGGVGPGEGEREREAAAVCKVGGRVAARRRRRKSHQSVGCIFHPNRFRAMITLSADRPTADADCAKKDHRRRRRGWKIGWSKLDICASHRGGEQHLSCLCLLQQNGVISHKYAARSPPFPFSPSTGGPKGGGGRGRGEEGEDESLHLSW